MSSENNYSLLDRWIKFCLHNKLIVFLFTLGLLFWGLTVAPFKWDNLPVPHDPIPVDAIPDIGENQQIVFTEWAGHSPQDIEDQVTYPLTTSLLGLPQVKTVRSYSMFGFSTIYVIFEEEAEFYWTRSRILEKLNSLPENLLPQNVNPRLGPDATALGQIFWYTLEGRDENGNPTGGWDLHELRSIQDWYVKYGLASAEGVAEVASVGGFVREYQIDLNPDLMRHYGVTLSQVAQAVRSSNLDVGARTLEMNKVEYVIRGVGFIENVDDLRKAVITSRDNVPITLDEVATIEWGPAPRRGALDKEGTEVVGGVVVSRFGENPYSVIDGIKTKIESIQDSLPRKQLDDGTWSQVTIVPFYDRTQLIEETLGTLESAITQQIIVTIIVVLLLLLHFQSSLIISSMMPLAVLFAFIAMKQFGVEANIVALSGIAIAIGTIVDMGIVLTENILNHFEQKKDEDRFIDTIFNACSEVSGAIFTSGLTTIVSFLPIFAMEGAEGKLFKPLAFTKTFTLMGSLFVALTIIPPLALLLARRFEKDNAKERPFMIGAGLLVALWCFFSDSISNIAGMIMVVFSINAFLDTKLSNNTALWVKRIAYGLIVVLLVVWLSSHWMPLGPQSEWQNALFILLLIGLIIGSIFVFIYYYERILRFILNYRYVFLSVKVLILLFGVTTWLGADRVFSWVPDFLRHTTAFHAFEENVPGLGQEFMPDLDEGSFLFMPTTMPHASIGEALDVMSKQNQSIKQIPEVDQVVGKIGRAESPLDPAPLSMIETVINYKSEFITDASGTILTFAYDSKNDKFLTQENGDLIPDEDGQPYRQWREHIKNPDDIWHEIVQASKIPGTTSAPKLQPIAARVVMLQSGMRASMGIKISGPSLESIEETALQFEEWLKEVDGISPATVFADRVVGKPYIEIHIDRDKISRYGMSVEMVQRTIEIALGGVTLTRSVEGRERYPIRLRYQRERRNSIEAIQAILVAGSEGQQIPLGQLTRIEYVRGPQAIKSEDTFLISYVIFDKEGAISEVEVVNAASAHLKDRLANSEWSLPNNVSYEFTGNYQNQLRANEKLKVVIPLTIFIIFILLYFNFRSLIFSLLIFSGIFSAWAGGFILLWLYGQPWFLNIELFGIDFQSLFQIQTIYLSVAVWVGFLALFGIATDDGVLICTYIQQRFQANEPTDIASIRETIIEASLKRVRPALMTSATTIIALLPVLTSTGRGADVMIPMAIPIFGGMIMAASTLLIVPTIYSIIAENKLKTK